MFVMKIIKQSRIFNPGEVTVKSGGNQSPVPVADGGGGSSNEGPDPSKYNKWWKLFG